MILTIPTSDHILIENYNIYCRNKSKSTLSSKMWLSSDSKISLTLKWRLRRVLNQLKMKSVNISFSLKRDLINFRNNFKLKKMKDKVNSNNHKFNPWLNIFLVNSNHLKTLIRLKNFPKLLISIKIIQENTRKIV